jgi:uncharacterized protein with HEPN domain
MNLHHNPRGPMLDMREAARRVVELTADQTEGALGPSGDWRFQASLERLLEVIGEAANRIPKDVQAQFPQIPWSAIIGMRNILVHAYDSIDPVKLWHAATVSVPELLEHLDAAIAQMPPLES